MIRSAVSRHAVVVRERPFSFLEESIGRSRRLCCSSLGEIMGYCPDDLPRSPLTTGACCYCISLRMGCMILAGGLGLWGALALLAGGSDWMAESVLQIIAGGLGFYAAYSRHLRCLKVFIVLVVLVLALHLGIMIFLFYMKPRIFALPNTPACEEAADPEKCREMVTGFRRGGNAQAILLELLFSGAVTFWVLVVFDSLRQVLAAAGSGDEKLSPKELEAQGRPNERSSLQP